MMVSEQELERLLRASQLVTTEDFDRRVLADAGTRLTHCSQKPRPLSSSALEGSSSRRRLLPTVTVLGGLLLVAAWWFTRPSDGWAQVVQAVRDKPWIHFSGKTPDNEDVDLWLSPAHQISASREPSYAAFHDFRTGQSESYSTDSGEIIRSESDAQSSDRRSFDAFNVLFRELFQGENSLSIGKEFANDPQIEKVEQSRQEIREGAEHWYDYVLVFRHVGHENQQQSTMAIRVDADSMLPQTMTLFEGNNGASGESMALRLAFPETGPKDIYDLGIPRDTMIADHTPQPLEGDRKKIIDGIREAAEGFDDYRAIFVTSKPDRPWHVGTPLLVWRKGGKMRLEIGCVDADNPPSTEVPDANAEREAWWTNRCRQLWFLPVQVFDGNSLYKCEYSMPPSELQPDDHPLTRSPKQWAVTGWTEESFRLSWPAPTGPLVWVYPESMEGLLASPLNETNIEAAPTDDSPEAIRVTAVSEGVARIDEWEYHLDRQRNFAVLESKAESFAIQDGEKTLQTSFSCKFDEWKQSPKGFWYPSQIQFVTTYLQDGELIRQIDVTPYYLDFNAKLPDSLFEPRERSEHGFPD